MNSVLLAIHQGLESTPPFMAALLEHDLLESFVLDIELDDGSQNRLAGFYIINEERLASLGGAALEKLSKAGHLQAAYMAIASLSNFRDLIETAEQPACWQSLTRSRKMAGLDPRSLPDTFSKSTQPLVLRGLVASWPAVQAGLESAAGGRASTSAGSIAMRPSAPCSARRISAAASSITRPERLQFSLGAVEARRGAR